jgi:hypothetical protein
MNKKQTALAEKRGEVYICPNDAYSQLAFLKLTAMGLTSAGRGKDTDC